MKRSLWNLNLDLPRSDKNVKKEYKIPQGVIFDLFNNHHMRHLAIKTSFWNPFTNINEDVYDFLEDVNIIFTKGSLNDILTTRYDCVQDKICFGLLPIINKLDTLELLMKHNIRFILLAPISILGSVNFHKLIQIYNKELQLIHPKTRVHYYNKKMKNGKKLRCTFDSVFISVDCDFPKTITYLKKYEKCNFQILDHTYNIKTNN